MSLESPTTKEIARSLTILSKACKEVGCEFIVPSLLPLAGTSEPSDDNPSIVNRPPHYQITLYDVNEVPFHCEVVDVIEAFVPNDGHLSHAFTYLCRGGKKDITGKGELKAMIEDYAKAVWWITRRIKFLGGHPEID